MISREAFEEHSPKLYDTARKIANEYKNQIKADNAIASGELYNFKWDIDLLNDGLKLVFDLPKQWGIVEYGRVPTKNPGTGQVRRSIAEWVRLKGLTPYPGQSFESMVYAITNKIHGPKKNPPKYTIKPRHTLEKSLNQSAAFIQQFEDIAVEMLNSEIENELEK